MARIAQRAARAEGRKTIAFRVFAATIALKSAVEVGLVIGSSASTTPRRLGDVLDPALAVLLDHPDGALAVEVVIEELRGDVVLHHLVLQHAEAGLLHRQARELEGVLEPGHDHLAHDAVDGLLVADPPEGIGRRSRGRDDPVESLDVERSGFF